LKIMNPTTNAIAMVKEATNDEKPPDCFVLLII
jgi:hypothetical protein